MWQAAALAARRGQRATRRRTEASREATMRVLMPTPRTPDRTRPTMLLVGALVLLGCAACQPDYPPPSIIDKLRIIGVRAEPPYIGLNEDFSPAPTTLDMLVVGQDPAETICYGWAFCPFAWANDGLYRCFDPSLQVDLGMAAAATVTAFDVFESLEAVEALLEDNPDLVPAPPTGGEDSDDGLNDIDDFASQDLYVLFKAAEAGSLPGGVCPASATEFLDAPCPDRSRCLAGYKRLAFALDPAGLEADPPQVLLDEVATHNNPVLEGIDAGPSEEGRSPWAAGDVRIIEEGQPVHLLPRWDPDSVDQYPSPVPGEPPRDEVVLFSWYATGGSYAQERSFDEFPDNVWTAPGLKKDEVSRDVDLWLIARDQRSGSDWLTRTIRVVPRAN